jgi:hypothetical protein
MSGLEAIPWKDYITTAAAFVGAILGIINNSYHYAPAAGAVTRTNYSG